MTKLYQTILQIQIFIVEHTLQDLHYINKVGLVRISTKQIFVAVSHQEISECKKNEVGPKQDSV